METAVLQEQSFELKEENLAQIGVYVKDNLADWLKQSPFFSADGYRSSIENQALLERIVRVEEGLKNQGQILEKILFQFDKRFEQVDKRFEEMRADMDKRFEQIDKRFERVDKRFEEMRADMDKRFEQVDKRFEEMRDDMDKRFEQVDKRFEQMNKNINHLFFYITTTGVFLAGIMTLYKFIPV